MSGSAHLFVLAMTLLCVGFILHLVRTRKLRAKYSILWLSVGGGLVVLAASPALLDRLSVALGITYGPATFFLGAITLLFIVVIHFSWELSRLEERSRTLAEEVALLRAAQPQGEAGSGPGVGPAPESGEPVTGPVDEGAGGGRG